MRRLSREIKIGNVKIGGGAPIVVQSMTNTDTRNVEATLAQIRRLADAGCEIVRVAVPDEIAAKALKSIRLNSPLPLIADIHFDYRLALLSIKSGIDGLRINPGNIGGKLKVDAVVDAAKDMAIPIRIGVNSGSVQKDLLEKYSGPTPDAMVESAMRHVRMLEDRNFFNTKISIKSSSVVNTIQSYRMLAKRCDYPLHLGVTEAGGIIRGTVKSSIGLGILLAEGIGDTIRVSLTSDPENEIAVAWEILRSLNLRTHGPNIISCPTCGRTEINLIELASKIEDYLKYETAPITVAIMGCPVNGPGEAKEADIGIAGGRDLGIIFKKGKIIKKIQGKDALFPAFIEELDEMLRQWKNQNLDSQSS